MQWQEKWKTSCCSCYVIFAFIIIFYLILYLPRFSFRPPLLVRSVHYKVVVIAKIHFNFFEIETRASPLNRFRMLDIISQRSIFPFFSIHYLISWRQQAAGIMATVIAWDYSRGWLYEDIRSFRICFNWRVKVRKFKDKPDKKCPCKEVKDAHLYLNVQVFAYIETYLNIQIAYKTPLDRNR